MNFKNNYGLFWVLPLFIVFLLTTIFPLLYVLNMSFMENYLPFRSPQYNGLKNYKEIFLDPLFHKVLWNTIVYVFFSVFFHILISLFLAFFLDKKKSLSRAAKALRVIYIVPWLLSWSAASAIWLLILNPSGILNGLISTLGGGRIQTAWFGEPRFAMFWILVVTIWKAQPFFMMMIYAALSSAPEELYESASLDGANAFQKFIYISFAHIKPIVLTLTILDVIWSLRQFEVFQLTTGGGPLDVTRTLSLHVYSTAFESLRFGMASSFGVIILIISSFLSFTYLRIYRRTEK